MDSATSVINRLSRSASSQGAQNGGFAPSRAEVREQLARLLDSPLFRSSRRYPGLLRFIIERKLDGHTEHLRERTLGVMVFGRRADYDTNQEPIVRVSAAEIRKRIAQYYHEPGHETELRIELPLRSYIPDFRPPAAASAKKGPPGSTAKKWWLALAACLSVVSLSWQRTTPFDQFWQPLIESNSPVSLCLASSAGEKGYLVDTGSPASDVWNIAWPDVVTVAKLAGLLRAKGQRYEIRREDQTKFNDFRQGAAILIGGCNDRCNRRFTSGERFSLQRDGSLCWIKDQQNPADRRWSIDVGHTDERGVPILAQDFAIVSRIASPKAGNMKVVMAALSGYATLAAGEFLTDRHFLEALAAQAPIGWEKKSMQVIIGTEVIDHTPGTPRILTVNIWYATHTPGGLRSGFCYRRDSCSSHWRAIQAS